VSARMLHLVSSTDVPAPVEVVGAPAVRIVDDCLGRQWAASPSRRTVWVLTGPPAVVGRRLAEALAAYTEPRTQLRSVGGAR
jgi:hypothetical protein